MPNPVYDEFIKTLAASQQQKSEQQIQTLRDLQIQDLRQKVAAGSPENLLRTLSGLKAQQEIENFSQTSQTQQIQNEADRVKAINDRTQAMLDAGMSGNKVVQTLINDKIVPEGTLATKVDAPWGGEKVWAFYNPSVPGFEKPRIFQPDVIKARRELSTNKNIVKYKADLDLMVDGYRWKGNDLEIIPNGPADIKGTNYKGMPNIQKLHVYRQNLIENGAPPKLIREVEDAINDPESSGQIIANLMTKVISHQNLTPDELRALDLYKTYGNPLAQALGQAIGQQPDSLRNQLLGGNSEIPIITNDEAGVSLYNSLKQGDKYQDEEGNIRTKGNK